MDLSGLTNPRRILEKRERAAEGGVDSTFPPDTKGDMTQAEFAKPRPRDPKRQQKLIQKLRERDQRDFPASTY